MLERRPRPKLLDTQRVARQTRVVGANLGALLRMRLKGGCEPPFVFAEAARTHIVKKTAKRGDPKELVLESRSGNVFADLGLPHPERELLKSRLTLQIYRLIKARGLKQTEAGKILGIKQPHVSAPMRNRSGSFSVERLMEFLTALGQDVENTDRPTRKQNGEMSVVA